VEWLDYVSEGSPEIRRPSFTPVEERNRQP
jgi:hypothetical protein